MNQDSWGYEFLLFGILGILMGLGFVKLKWMVRLIWKIKFLIFFVSIFTSIIFTRVFNLREIEASQYVIPFIFSFIITLIFGFLLRKKIDSTKVDDGVNDK